MSLLNPTPPSEFELKKRMIQKMHSALVNDVVLEAIQQLFAQTLSTENIILSRAEQQRLFREVAKSILTDILTKLEKK